eukprot:COSAG01_NODE_24340_length_782_cov_1.701318_3_plen_104_part_00
MGLCVFICLEGTLNTNKTSVCNENRKNLWGEKWQDVLPGHKDHDKLAVCLFLRIPKSWFEDASRVVPGRDNVRSILSYNKTSPAVRSAVPIRSVHAPGRACAI